MLSVQLLGPVEVFRDAASVDLGGPQQRAVLAHLALDVGRVISAERLIDRLWSDEPPRTPLGTLQSYVSRLRGAIEPDRPAGTPPSILVSEAPGYVLRIAADRVDVHRFAALAATARAAAGGGRHLVALESFDAALALWRGPALGGLSGDDPVRSIVARLDEERHGVTDDRFEALLAVGRHVEATPALQAAVDEDPLRERRCALLALALYRSGRQADALRVLTRARSTLLDDLGLDPGPEMRELESRILAHDPTLLTFTVAHSVTAISDEPSAADGPIPVGRTAEWTKISSAFDDAATGRGHLVLVEGEPGIGKSTLCEAVLTDAEQQGWRTATGRCVEDGLAPTLWPCLEVVRSMVDRNSHEPRTSTGPSTSTSMLRRMASANGAGDSTVSPVQIAEQFVALLDELGRPPWVILLDDLHWADQATLRLIALVLERIGSRPLLIIAAYRPPQLAPGSLLGAALGGFGRASAVTRIEMSPFDAGDVARLIEQTIGAHPTAAVAARVQARTGGNPLFVTELARLAGERGVNDDSEVPDAIRDVVRARLRQLPPSCTAELEVAAVLGERFDLRTAMATSERDPDDCLDALDAAIVTRILVPDGDGFRFAHALVRDAVLAELSPLRRARLHDRAAAAIAATRGDHPDAAEPIAHHRLEAASVTDPIAVAKAAVRASDVARWRGAFDAADRLAQRALETLDGAARTPALVDVEVEALEALVSTSRRRGDPAAIAAVTDRVEAIAKRSGNDAARALVVFLRWGSIDEATDLDELAPWLDQAAELAARTDDPYATIVTRYMLAAWGWLRGDIDAAAEHSTLAIAASDAVHPDARPAHVPLALLPQVASWIAALAGDEAGAREHAYRRAPAWMSQRNEVDPTGSVALTFYRALLEALLDEPARVAGQLAELPVTGSSAFIAFERAASDLLAAWAAARSDNVGAHKQAVVAMARVEAGDERIVRSCLRTFVGDALLRAGDRRAVRTLAQARIEAEQRKETFWLAETIRLQAEADRRFSTGTAALDLLDQAETLAMRQGARLLLPRIAASRDQHAPVRT